MTKEETIRLLELLNAYYAGGKNDPKQQAYAWHLIMQKYDFNDAMAAVLRFVENDRRSYGGFPGVGNIVDEIKQEETRKNRIIKHIVHSVQYGKDYDQLDAEARALIPEDSYNKWLRVEPEEFAQKADKFADFLRTRQFALEAAE